MRRQDEGRSPDVGAGTFDARALGVIRESERPLVRRAEDFTRRVSARGTWERTDFLSPRERLLVASVIRRDGLVASSYGGYADAERVRLLIMPADWYPEPADFQVITLGVRTTETLSHGAVLGAILGTGVERRKIGDIALADSQLAYVAVCSALESHLRLALRQVGRATVTLETLQDVAWQVVTYEPAMLTVASLRVDAVVAQACHWSRSRAKDAVDAGNVSLNHAPCERTDETVEPGDILSVRGFGRIRIFTHFGQTKKDRERLEVGILRSRK